jgi:ribosomal-protein-alanine N-acetyltransferase
VPVGPPSLSVDGDLRLRGFVDADAPAVLRAYTDPDIRRWNLRSMATTADARMWIDATRAAWAAGTGATWAVVGADDDLLCRVTLHLRLGEEAGEVTYWVVPEARGRGVATRAVRAATSWAHEAGGVVRLELRHSTQNPASCRVAERAGFAAEGVLRSARRHDDGWHDVHLHAHVAMPYAGSDEDEDEDGLGGDPPCWEGLVDDHRDHPPSTPHP